MQRERAQEKAMASKVVYVDFRGGMIDERMRRRSDLDGYYNSASLIENAVPTRAGGLRLRPGLVRYSDNLDAKRIIPYTKSVNESFAVALAENKATVYGLGTSNKLIPLGGGAFSTSFKSSEIPSIQFTQDYERAILTHENHVPYVIIYKDGGVNAFDMELDKTAETYRVDGKDDTVFYTYEELLNGEGNYPSCCAYMGQRLWLMATRKKPYKMFASRPFSYNDFQLYDKIQSVQEGTTTEQYLKAVQGSYTDTKTVEQGSIEKYPTAVKIKTVVNVSADGYYTKTLTYYDSEGLVVGSEVAEAVNYTTPVYSWTDRVRDDCGMELELGSDRDERVSWIGYAQNGLYIGTASSEWYMPADANANNYSFTKIGSYGSARNMQCVYGSNAIFYVQSGGKRIRAISSSSDGIAFSEPSYQCETILKAGIKEMHWQRVPEPRLYAVLKDGTMAVLSYDPYYSINAWCKWTFPSIKIVSMSILDDESGQTAVVLGEDANGNRALYRFDESALTDDGTAFKAVVTTNNIEGDGTLPYWKKVNNIFVDSFRTEFKARSNSGASLTPRSFDKDLIKMDVYSASTYEGLRMTIESIEGKPFELIALALEVEVSE